MRYLGLDVGERSIGVAVGEKLASEKETIRAGKDKRFYDSPELSYDQIAKIVDEEQADAIVVGLPINEDGQLSPEAVHIKKFTTELGLKLDKTINFVNETLSSFMAQDILESQGLSIQEAKVREHQLAAQLILQQYLEENVSP